MHEKSKWEPFERYKLQIIWVVERAAMNNIKGWIKTWAKVGFLQCLLSRIIKHLYKQEEAATWSFWLVRGLKFRAGAECQVFNTVWSRYDVQSCFLECPVASRHFGTCQVPGPPRGLQRLLTSKTGVNQKQQFFSKCSSLSSCKSLA